MTLAEVVRDAQYAVRSLSRSRTFVLVAIASLGLGIGADTAAFSLVDAVVWRPLPFPSPDQLVDVHEWSSTKLCAGCSVGTSFDTYTDWKTAKSFVTMGAYREEAMALAVDGQAERVSGAPITASLYSTLAVQAQIGRVFTATEDRAGGAPVVVISHDLWVKRFASDTTILGRSVRLNGVARTIIGVMPREFRFPEFAQLWIPLGQTVPNHDREDRNTGVVARLAQGIDIGRANHELFGLATAIAKDNPKTNAEWTAKAVPLREDLAGTESQLFVVLLGAVTLVLLIVCANLAGLSLARGSARRRELAIRLALGASRARVVRLLLAESALLAVLGGALGVLLAWWTIDFVSAQFASMIPYWIQFQIDARVLTFAAGAAVLTTLAFGLVPALRASRPDVKAELQDGGSNASMGQGGLRLRAALVVAELSVSLVLLAASGLLIKTFLRISEPDHVDRRGLLTGQLELLDTRYADSSRVVNASKDLLERVTAIPTVQFAALSRTQFLAGFGAQDNRVRIENVEQVPAGVSPRFAAAVTPDYFRTMRMDLAAGRAFTPIDRAGSELVAILDESIAKSLWPSGGALGRRIKLIDADDQPWYTVVGITRDPVANPNGARARGMAYIPLAQSPGRPLSLFIRVTSDRPLTLAPSIRTAVAQVDPDVPLLDFMSAEDAHNRAFWPFKLYAIVMSSFAALAVMLAVVGVYGIVAYGVTQRSREIGVRVALGASRQDVVVMLALQGLKLAGAGIGIGLLLSAAVLRVMQGMMFGASTMDPGVMVAVALIVGASALLASWVPANRAATADPASALRVD